MLTPIQQSKLEKLLEDADTVEAISVVLRESVESDLKEALVSLGLKAEISNDKLGEITRATAVAKKFVINGLKELEKFKKQDEEEVIIPNPAR